MVDDDSFLDWETRHDSFPFHKHIIAGKYFPEFYRYLYHINKDNLNNLCIGSCAGIMEHVGMFPLDTVKVRTILLEYKMVGGLLMHLSYNVA